MSKFKDYIIIILLVICICCSVAAATKTGVIEGPQGEQGIQGIQGPQGEQGPQGIQGETGLRGPAGEDGKDGIDGKNGLDGKDGADGKDGLTPYIGEDGLWYIGTDCTGVAATKTVYTSIQADVIDKVDLNWTSCKVGDTVAFTFRPFYVSSQARGYYVYSYQTDSVGNKYAVHTTSYTIGDTTYTPPKNGQEDIAVFNETFACIGKVVSKDSIGINVEIIEAVRTN